MKRELQKKLKAMIGADEFKNLLLNLESSYINLMNTEALEAFYNRAFLFSINAGDGLHYQLSLLADFFSEIEDEVVEIKTVKLAQPDIMDAESAKKISPREIINYTLEQSGLKLIFGYRIVCVDISDWIDQCESSEFRAILSFLKPTASDQRIVFRIPAVDEVTLLRVKEAIGHFIAVEEVYTPPFTIDQYYKYAKQLMEEDGISIDSDAMDDFKELIRTERNSFYFWGFESIRRILDELLLEKLREDYGADNNEA